MKALLSEGGMVEEERVLARIVEQHPEHAAAFMDAGSHFSSGDPDSPFVHIGLHLNVERGVVSRELALEEIWGADGETGTNVVDRYVAYLRRKLGEPVLIHTVRGVGFRLGA